MAPRVIQKLTHTVNTTIYLLHIKPVTVDIIVTKSLGICIYVGSMFFVIDLAGLVDKKVGNVHLRDLYYHNIITVMTMMTATTKIIVILILFFLCNDSYGVTDLLIANQ